MYVILCLGTRSGIVWFIFSVGNERNCSRSAVQLVCRLGFDLEKGDFGILLHRAFAMHGHAIYVEVRDAIIMHVYSLSPSATYCLALFLEWCDVCVVL